MSAVSDLVTTLIDHGIAPADAAVLVARAGAEMSMAAPSKGAERTRRWRERLASQTVTERHTETDDPSAEKPSPNVTNRHSDVTGDNRSYLSSHSSSVFQPLETAKKEKKKEATRRRVGCELPDDWSPGDKHYREAAEHGRLPLDVQQLGEEMRLWSKANAHRAIARKSDWDSTFTGWMRREWGKPNGVKNGQRIGGSNHRADESSIVAALVGGLRGRNGAPSRDGREDVPRGKFELDLDPEVGGGSDTRSAFDST